MAILTKKQITTNIKLETYDKLNKLKKGENEMTNELNKKGNIYLLEYECGLYCVDRITKSIGETLFASFDLKEAQNFFEGQCNRLHDK